MIFFQQANVSIKKKQCKKNGRISNISAPLALRLIINATFRRTAKGVHPQNFRPRLKMGTIDRRRRSFGNTLTAPV
ncbi:MAG: hypothetical protein CRN43_08035 [Candidatus Nephrothrix sp. EaCA]|nr:MAG: hypothetical protein CRN43_08035 [Candidatus Nephrothrix sp. EaCA]